MIHLYPEGTAARFFQESPIAGIDLLEASKEAIQAIPNPLHPARLQLQAAIELVEIRHAPKRNALGDKATNADIELLQLKQSGEIERRRCQGALALQQQYQDATGATL